MKYLGIDPGISGAIAVIDGETEDVRFFDTPILKVQGPKRTTSVIDAAGIVQLLRQEVDGRVHVVLEKVSAAPISLGAREPCPACGRVPQQGATATFHFGEGFGMWEGILAGLRLPYTLVHPATWKSKLMRDQGKDKQASILRAKQLYPQAAPCLNLKKHHGRADALLLAHYGKVFLYEVEAETVLW